MLLLIMAMLQAHVSHSSMKQVVANSVMNHTELLKVATNSTIDMKEVEALRAEVARLKAKAKSRKWSDSANHRISEIRNQVEASGETRTGSETEIVEETKKVLREAEIELIEQSETLCVE